MNDPFPTPWGELTLHRFPDDPRERFRAWDAADAYLLRHLAEQGPKAARPVVVGDRWGALTTALADRGPVLITDSYLAREATRANLAAAGHAPDTATLLTSREAPPDRIDLLLVRVPKSLAFLEDQLHRLAPSVHEGTTVLATGMVKEIHTSTLRLFEQILGPTTTSLAERKARLVFCAPRPGGERDEAPANPWPHRYALPPDTGVLAGRTVTNHAGVFCASHLDIGTRFFLQHLPTGLGTAEVADLGCGNGVVGTALALAEPGARLHFTDESYQALASAEATFRENLGADRAAEFRVGDGLADFPPGSLDLVLCNPPFHSHQATTDTTAWRMFTGARRALRPGGELWVVGNRHLGYHAKLRRLFGGSQLVASAPKFVVLRAAKR
ncbi:methyltransferase [Streptomyces sp. SCSIO ZS0520]|uniref:methyltransferase n=1 Tax=Streptomyces sp. SCSIO ZS0520 TaxID=2892996 RepID=UPI0021DB7B8F|nr:methyltransferase [Streptomyces sp. SCSIO ZS0520]